MINSKELKETNKNVFDTHKFLPKNFKEVLKQMRSSSMEKRLKKFGIIKDR